MKHGVVAAKIIGRDVADIFAYRRDRTALAAKPAVFVEEGVEPCYLVAGARQHARHHRPDISVMPGEKSFHSLVAFWWYPFLSKDIATSVVLGCAIRP